MYFFNTQIASRVVLEKLAEYKIELRSSMTVSVFVRVRSSGYGCDVLDVASGGRDCGRCCYGRLVIKKGGK